MKNKAEVIEKFSKRLRQERCEAKLNQMAAAKKCGISRVTLNRLENGVMLPNVWLLYKLARGLGVEAKDLLPPMSRRRSGSKSECT